MHVRLRAHGIGIRHATTTKKHLLLDPDRRRVKDSQSEVARVLLHGEPLQGGNGRGAPARYPATALRCARLSHAASLLGGLRASDLGRRTPLGVRE
jgi:hypothetical protein